MPTTKTPKLPKTPKAPKKPKLCSKKKGHNWCEPGGGELGLYCRDCPARRTPEEAAAAPAKIPTQAEIVTERTREQGHVALKCKVRMFYDTQRLRLQTGGRGASKPKTQDDEHEPVEEAAAQAPPERPRIELHPADLAVLNRRTEELVRAEKHALDDIAEHLGTIGFYRDVLSDKARYRGIGPTMAGVILGEFDIYRLETASQMWAFAGLAPVAAERCTKCHDVVVDGTHRSARTACKGAPPPSVYSSGKSMKPTRGQRLPYNAFLRSKLCGVLGAVLLKLNPSQPLTGPVSPWRKCYDDYKLRKQSEGWGTSDAHRHAASIRYMIKMLLADIWTKWRTYEGLAVRPSYHEEKLGHRHSGGFQERIVQPTAEPMSDEVRAELESAGELH